MKASLATSGAILLLVGHQGANAYWLTGSVNTGENDDFVPYGFFTFYNIGGLSTAASGTTYYSPSASDDLQFLQASPAANLFGFTNGGRNDRDEIFADANVPTLPGGGFCSAVACMGSGTSFAMRGEVLAMFNEFRTAVVSNDWESTSIQCPFGTMTPSITLAECANTGAGITLPSALATGPTLSGIEFADDLSTCTDGFVKLSITCAANSLLAWRDINDALFWPFSRERKSINWEKRAESSNTMMIASSGRFWVDGVKYRLEQVSSADSEAVCNSGVCSGLKVTAYVFGTDANQVTFTATGADGGLSGASISCPYAYQIASVSNLSCGSGAVVTNDPVISGPVVQDIGVTCDDPASPITITVTCSTPTSDSQDKWDWLQHL